MVQNENESIEIPIGHCQCGCGLQTNTYKVNNKKLNYKRGEYTKYIRGHQNRKLPKIVNLQLCECGCGQYTKICGTPTKDTKRGDPNRFIIGHNSLGTTHSIETRTKMSKNKRGCEAIFSPIIPNLLVRMDKQKSRWYARDRRNNKTAESTHAKIVYETFVGPVPKGYKVHHKNGDASKLENDVPENLMVVANIWNFRYFPQLALGFGVHESVVTKVYEKLVNKVSDNLLFCEVTLELSKIKKEQDNKFEIKNGLIRTIYSKEDY